MSLFLRPLTHRSQWQFKKGQWCLWPLRFERTPWLLQRVHDGFRSFLVPMSFSRQELSMFPCRRQYSELFCQGDALNLDQGFFFSTITRSSKLNNKVELKISDTCQSFQHFEWWLDKSDSSRGNHTSTEHSRQYLSSLVYFPCFICCTIFKLTLETARLVRKPRWKNKKVTFLVRTRISHNQS